MTTDEGPRSFSVLLQHIDDGALHAELSEVIQTTCKQLSTLVDSLGRDQKATITLKLDLTYGRSGHLVIQGEVNEKTPKMPHAPTVAWLSRANNIIFENPRQQKLPLREVGVDVRPARILNDDQVEAKTV